MAALSTPASFIAATSASCGVGRSTDQVDCLPPSGASGKRLLSVEMTCGWMSTIEAMASLSSWDQDFKRSGLQGIDEHLVKRHALGDQLLLQPIGQHRLDARHVG